MGKHDSKITRAAHIKHRTKGTSNEISFSVLDAAKNALDGGETPSDAHRFGAISLFTMSGKKSVSTPVKERGLHLPGGGFVSTESSSSSPSSDGFGKGKTGRFAAPRISLPMPSKKSNDSSSSETAEQGTFGSRMTPVSEVAAKKRGRKTRKFLATAVAFCAVVAVIGGMGYWLYNNHLIYQDNLGQLNKAVTLVTEADATMLLLDEQVQVMLDDGQSPVLSSEQQSAINDVKVNLPEAQVHLENALLFANNALEGLSDTVDKEAATQIINSIQARKSMIEPALALLGYAMNATEASDAAEDAWLVLLEADSLARTAASYLADPTIENLKASIAKTKEGVAKLREASSLFSAAQAAYPEADFSAYQEYIAKRTEALNYAIASDQALVNRNLEEAVVQNDAYAMADTEAAELAERLPLSPTGPIEDAIYEATADMRQAYLDARLKASASDSFLRDYLGSSV